MAGGLSNRASSQHAARGDRQPRFSVVIPAFDAHLTLGNTLSAVLAETSADWECIVVDDGSTDDTLSIARDFERRDPRFRVIHQANGGTASAYNTAIAAARGEFVTICSADDVLLPEHLSRFSAFIDANPGYDIYSSNGWYWRPSEGRDLVDYDERSRGAHSKSLADVIRLCFYSVGATYRRELFDRAGGYRSEAFGEDYDFWLRAMALGAKHRYLPAPLSLFRVSAGQKSAELERGHRSNIRIVSELRDNFVLSPEERRAVEEKIAEENLRIVELQGGLVHGFRRRFEGLAVSVFGRTRARRAWQSLRMVLRRLDR